MRSGGRASSSRSGGSDGSSKVSTRGCIWPCSYRISGDWHGAELAGLESGWRASSELSPGASWSGVAGITLNVGASSDGVECAGGGVEGLPVVRYAVGGIANESEGTAARPVGMGTGKSGEVGDCDSKGTADARGRLDILVPGRDERRTRPAGGGGVSAGGGGAVNGGRFTELTGRRVTGDAGMGVMRAVGDGGLRAYAGKLDTGRELRRGGGVAA